MYLAVDIGGTKTAIATFSDNGILQNSLRIPTAPDYEQFKESVRPVISQMVGEEIPKVVCVAAPGLLDRKAGIAVSEGNLPWKNVPIKADFSALVQNSPVVIENDSKLGGIAESHQFMQYQKLLYITIGTGIGTAFLDHQQLVTDFIDAEGGKMPLEFENKIVAWESFAGGHAIIEKFQKKAAEITDAADWQTIAHNLALGTGILCSLFQPEAIIYGGGVGQYADKFTESIKNYLALNLHPNIRQPKLLAAAKYGDDSVLYGCYYVAENYARSHP